jgi:heat shock protein HtpX
VDAGTFYDRIESNRRKSLLLLFCFVLFVMAFGFVVGYAWFGDPVGAAFTLVLALVAGSVSGLMTYYAGDKMVLAASRARQITHEDHPRLFNIVEEMSIAGGLPMPKVYIIEESAPNAFATGRDPEHASIAVTSGLLKKLDRDELQGVIAHEMAHVGNLDIRYAMLVGVLVGTVVLISDFFLRSLWFGGGRQMRGGGKGGNQLQLIMIVLAIALAILAPIFAKLLQLSISRQREYLADATAVKLTRNPKGLADALEKISGNTEPLRAANRATSHLYIVNPIKKQARQENRSSLGWFSTHPPIEERIRILRSMETGGIPESIAR